MNCTRDIKKENRLYCEEEEERSRRKIIVMPKYKDNRDIEVMNKERYWKKMAVIVIYIQL